MTDAALALHGVGRRLAKAVVLDEVSFTVEAGRAVALAGPPGSGKTALLRLIACLIRPETGTISVFGHDAVRDPAAVQAITGYVPQAMGLAVDLTVAEHLRLHAALRNLCGAARRERIGFLLRRAGLEAEGDVRVGALPGGARRKLALACALIDRPRLLLLDDPVDNLDGASHEALLGIALSLAAEGTTVLWSTSSLDEAERFDRAIFMMAGRVVFEGAPAELCAASPWAARSIRAVGAARRGLAARLRSAPGVRDVRIEADRVRFLVERVEAELADRPADLGASEPCAARLEDLVRGADPEPPPGHGPRPPAPAVPTSPAAPAVLVEGVGRRFGRAEALAEIAFAVAPGELFGIVGPAGSGKTTLLRMLAGLLRPEAGRIRVAGIDLRAAPDRARRRIGYMPQRFSLYGELSVAENLRFFARAYGLTRRQSAEQVARRLAELGLEPFADVPAERLQPGAKQRLAYAASVVHEPEILLLDDPGAMVDPVTRRAIWRRIEEAAAGGATVIVGAGNVAEAAACDRLLLLDGGRVVALGAPDEMMRVGRQPGPRPVRSPVEPRSSEHAPGEAA